MAADLPVRPEIASTAETGARSAVRAVNWRPVPAEPVGKPGSVFLTAPERHLEKALADAGIKTVSKPGAKSTIVITEGLKLPDPTARHWAVLEVARQCRGRGNRILMLEKANGALSRISGLQGLARTLRQEWPEVGIACWSLAAPASKLDLLGAFSAELEDAILTPDGPMAQSVAPNAPPLSGKGPETPGVWLVSGGARGVTSDCVLALAERLGGGTVLLAGRSPIAPWPEGIADTGDLKALRLALIEKARAQGEKPLPKEVDRAARAALAGREIRATLAGLQACGVRAEYLQLDLGDADRVKEALAKAQAQHGAITGLIHGAGVLADGLAETKTREDVGRVFAPKLQGFLNLMAALEPAALSHIGLFSSASAVFGNIGQSDYAMANAWLSRVARQLAEDLPDAQVKSFCWGPWNGGMVDEALAAHFRARGIGLIERADGAAIFADHLLYGDRADVELLVGDEW
ncbi:MAG: SDR family NAD(P)-dependent oxidoreductase [Hyphomonadaceae bacterium]|nr:SDR family NAD(P)-dependent oxidoreductase [Hyphomonadaceae bacterium]